MVLVAVAGGSSRTLGRSIVSAIIESGDHEVIILSRTPSKPVPHALKYGAPVRYVDYSCVSSLADSLLGVHTLISVVDSNDPAEMVRSHLNMLEAAKAVGIKRFAPSEFGFGLIAAQSVDILKPKLEVWAACRASGLQCTRFVVGMFTNYLGHGCPSDRRAEALSGLDDGFLLDLIDIENNRALVPLRYDGRPAKLSMCELRDVGRFVAAALDLPSWPEELGMVGSTTSMDEIAWVAERTGRLMYVTNVTQEQIQQRIHKLDQELREGFNKETWRKKMLAQMIKCICDEELGSAVVEPTLNRLCPDVKPIGFEEYLARYWANSREPG